MEHPHIILGNEYCHVERFKTAGGGSSEVKIKDRATQASSVSSWYNGSLEEYNTAREDNVPLEQYRSQGFYLEMTVTADKAGLESLDGPTGAQLMNIVPGSSESLLDAALFLPDDKKEWLNKKVEKYCNPHQDSASGNPRGAKFINLIEGIKPIRTIDFFTISSDRENYQNLPSDFEMKVEVWLSNEYLDYKEKEVEEKLDYLGISQLGKALNFTNATVILVKAKKAKIEKLCYSLNGLSELRIFREVSPLLSNSYREENEWLRLIKDSIVISDNPVRVGILDSGVNREHNLLSNFLPEERCHNESKALSTRDKLGHGTGMAGLALYGDLTDAISQTETLNVIADLSSVKIVPGRDEPENEPELYGVRTEAGIVDGNNDGAVIFSMAVTADGDCNGEASSWSAAIDEKLFNNGEPNTVLFISAGNVKETGGLDYPDYCINKDIEDPGQSWNAVTVGAFTEKVVISDPDYRDRSPEAPEGCLSPYSSSSLMWENGLVKPEILMEGGNAIKEGTRLSNAPDDLCLVTTSSKPSIHQFESINATSAATALATRLASKIKYSNPSLTALSIRALIIHSATWTENLIRQFGNDKHTLLHTCGYGIPCEAKAIMSEDSYATFISQQVIHPYKEINGKKCRLHGMHLYDLPWPKKLLEEMGDAQVTLKITLSFYIEPAPGKKTKLIKYLYPSTVLRFDLNNPEETKDEFISRVSHISQEGVDKTTNDSTRWNIGIQNRNNGSIISDSITDSAVKLASCSHIAIYPASGWLKNRQYKEEYNNIQYSLVVSLETPGVDVYNAIPIKVPIEA